MLCKGAGQNTADHRATLPARTIRSFTRARPVIRSFGSGGEHPAPAHTNNSCSRDNGRPMPEHSGSHQHKQWCAPTSSAFKDREPELVTLGTTFAHHTRA
ncbi:MAG: hypothetical protein Q7S29_03885 [Candidatus Peribacter sp.]|nr:hypothetical protein [Candidatus Peribacter sp.]